MSNTISFTSGSAIPLEPISAPSNHQHATIGGTIETGNKTPKPSSQAIIDGPKEGTRFRLNANRIIRAQNLVRMAEAPRLLNASSDVTNIESGNSPDGGIAPAELASRMKLWRNTTSEIGAAKVLLHKVEQPITDPIWHSVTSELLSIRKSTKPLEDMKNRSFFAKNEGQPYVWPSFSGTIEKNADGALSSNDKVIDAMLQNLNLNENFKSRVKEIQIDNGQTVTFSMPEPMEKLYNAFQAYCDIKQANFLLCANSSESSLQSIVEDEASVSVLHGIGSNICECLNVNARSS